MRKITKKAQKCSKCGQITKREEYEEFCDECGKKINFNSKRDISFTINFILHRKNDFSGKYVDFCSAKCMFRWLLINGKKTLQHSDDFFSLDYWNRKNIDELFELLNKKKLYVKIIKVEKKLT